MKMNKVLAVAIFFGGSAVAFAAAPTLVFPSSSYEQSGFTARLEQNAATRQKMTSFMVSQGDDAAGLGIAYSQAEWMSLYRSIASITGPDLTGEFLELLRRNQNAKAAQARQQR